MRLSRDLEITIFRIVQAALSNVHRHSGSTTAEVSVSQEDHQVTATIRDGGSPQTRRQGQPRDEFDLGVGIPGMRERAAQFGGEIEVITRAAGTTVIASIPLPERNYGSIR
jgi:signal transduction histidine kinase